MVIDPTTSLGMLRLRCADTSDLPYLPDTVYSQALVESGGNLPQAAKTCAMYILGMLSQKTHRKLAQLEVWGSEAYSNYRDYLMLTVSNPAFMTTSPIPYSSSAEFSPIVDFQQNWNKAYYNNTESQQLARIADLSPNDGSRLGFYGNAL